MTSILVVGAGIAGLSAGYRLSQAGFDVRVVEAAAAPGGRMADLRDGDIAYNSGARLIYPFGQALWDLIRELGLEAVPIRNLSAACRIDGTPYRLDLMPTARTLRTPGLTWNDRLRLVRFWIRLVRLRSRVDPDDLASGAEFDGETLAAFMDRVLGQRVRARLIDPLFRGTRSWNPDQISAAFLMTTLPHMLNRNTVFALAGGMGRLTRELAERLRCECGRRVTGVSRQPDGGCRTSFADGDTVDTDLVLMAVEGALAASLLVAPEPEETRFFAALRYNSLGVVHYALREDVPPVMRFIDQGEGLSIATYQQLPAAPQAGRDEGTTLLPAHARGDAGWRRYRGDGAQGCAPAVARILTGWLRPTPCSGSSTSCPCPIPDSRRKMAQFREWQAAAPRRVYFCGDYLAQALVTGACASGVRTAGLVAQHWPEMQPC